MRKSHRNAWNNVNRSRSEINIIPPWCSSGKVSRRKLVPKCEIQSSYPLREDIWEYLHKENCGKRKVCKQRRNRKTKLVTVLVITLLGFTGLLWTWSVNATPSFQDGMAWMDQLITIAKSSFGEYDLCERSYLYIGDTPWLLYRLVTWKPSVSDECSYKMRYLSLELSRAEHKLRLALLGTVDYILAQENLEIRANSTYKQKLGLEVITSHQLYVTANHNTAPVAESNANRYIEGAIVTKGSDTMEWGSRAALWGIVPLWKASPPANTVLSLRSPTPADCWPFSGSEGELIFQLPNNQRISGISIEHIRPDKARSAPKHFTIYGTLANNSLVKMMDNQYQQTGPAKQYFAIGSMPALRRLVIKVLTNQGNVKYTCIYRIHLYGNNEL